MTTLSRRVSRLEQDQASPRPLWILSAPADMPHEEALRRLGVAPARGDLVIVARRFGTFANDALDVIAPPAERARWLNRQRLKVPLR